MRWLTALLMMIVAAPAAAQSGMVTNVSAPANVKVLRPLQLTTLRNLDFGTIVMGTITANQTVSVSQTGRSCGSGGQLTCTGTFATAQFRVTGTNNQVVLIRSATPTATLTNAAGKTLTLTPILPAPVTMPNSGNQGVTFQVGGSLVITPTTADGLYSGTIDIQVAYQ
jgi:hypothetical protein